MRTENILCKAHFSYFSTPSVRDCTRETENFTFDLNQLTRIRRKWRRRKQHIPWSSLSLRPRQATRNGSKYPEPTLNSASSYMIHEHRDTVSLQKRRREKPRKTRRRITPRVIESESATSSTATSRSLCSPSSLLHHAQQHSPILLP